MCIRYVPVGTSSYETKHKTSKTADAVPRQTVPAGVRLPAAGWLAALSSAARCVRLHGAPGARAPRLVASCHHYDSQLPTVQRYTGQAVGVGCSLYATTADGRT